jgi:hypothetical protein
VDAQILKTQQDADAAAEGAAGVSAVSSPKKVAPSVAAENHHEGSAKKEKRGNSDSARDSARGNDSARGSDSARNNSSTGSGKGRGDNRGEKGSSLSGHGREGKGKEGHQ